MIAKITIGGVYNTVLLGLYNSGSLKESCLEKDAS